IRDMMLYHTERFDDPKQRIGHSRALLDFLARSVPQDKSPYSLMLKEELAQLSKQEDNYLFHDHLEECNDPIYFHQFVKRARAREMKYLGEVEIAVMLPRNFPREVEQVLQRLSSDLIQIEQYMDFLR